jgi:hypothetical protein
MIAGYKDTEGPETHAPAVATAVRRASTYPSAPLRIPAGDDAEQWMAEAG